MTAGYPLVDNLLQWGRRQLGSRGSGSMDGDLQRRAIPVDLNDGIRRFLREVGLPESSIGSNRGDLVSYLRSRLGM